MCTVLTLDQQKLFGRTMDFPPRTPWRLTFLPRGYQWKPASSKEKISDQYAILGGMRMVGDHYLIGDGINEQGLVCAELFFPVAADYGESQSDSLSLTPQDFIHWVLANHATVSELINDLKNIRVVKKPWYDQQQYPFHWILMDASGTYGIEPLAGELVVFKNEVGAYTNTPAYSEHLKKLNHFLGLQSTDFTVQTKAALNRLVTPPVLGRNASDRFILAAQARWGAKISTPQELADFLQSVTIPKNQRHPHNYTHYQAIINQQSGEYRFYDQFTQKVTSYNVRQNVPHKEVRRFE